MATINSVSPTTGISTGRYIVVIDGADFRIPDLVPGSDTAQESVRVWVDGNQVEPSDVFVRTTSKVEFRMLPSYHTVTNVLDNDPYLVDVKVQNVDANGDLIPGSDDTLVDGFSYVKIDQDVDSIMNLVFRVLIQHLRRNLPVPVFSLSHVDYSTGNAVLVANGPEQASDPAVYIVGPRRETNNVGTQRVRDTWPVTDPEMRWLPRATDLLFDLTIVSSHERILENLMPAIDNLIHHMPKITLTIMGKPYEMDAWMVDPMSTDNTVLFSSSLQQASGTLRIESVPLETDIIRLNKDLDTINISIGVLNA